MEKLKTLLIANRGEIAVRIIRTAKELGVVRLPFTRLQTQPHDMFLPRTMQFCYREMTLPRTLTGYRVSVRKDLSRELTRAVLNRNAIIEIARSHQVDAIIPGYGFLSENVEFAEAIANAGMVFVGPRSEAIEAFGLKHRAREIAVAAGVPIVPGTQGPLVTEDEAVKAADELGYPVMLKATGGVMICNSAEEIRKSLSQVRSRGETLFKNAGVFMERYYPESHHIEVQVFGNGLGDAIHIGERECSIQRRHQKVVEECPSPFVERHPGLRQTLTSAAVSLSKSVRYGSAGTVEYLVDDTSGDFFFLEMNTRLQVEHGITELCYELDTALQGKN